MKNSQMVFLFFKLTSKKTQLNGIAKSGIEV